MSRRSRLPSHPCSGCALDSQLLGEVKGKLDMIHEAQKAQGTKLDAIEVRMRKTENRTAALGGAAGLCMALCTEFIKTILRRT